MARTVRPLPAGRWGPTGQTWGPWPRRSSPPARPWPSSTGTAACAAPTRPSRRSTVVRSRIWRARPSSRSRSTVRPTSTWSRPGGRASDRTRRSSSWDAPGGPAGPGPALPPDAPRRTRRPARAARATQGDPGGQHVPAEEVTLLLAAEPVPSGTERLSPGPVPQLLVDGDGSITAANAAAAGLLGRAEPSELLGRAPRRSAAPGRRTRDPPAHRPQRERGRLRPPLRGPARGQAQVFRPDGSVTWLDIHHAPPERRPARRADRPRTGGRHRAAPGRAAPPRGVRRPAAALRDGRSRRSGTAANAAWRTMFAPLLPDRGRLSGGPGQVTLNGAGPVEAPAGGAQGHAVAASYAVADVLDAEGATAFAEALEQLSRGDRTFFQLAAVTSPAAVAPQALRLRGSPSTTSPGGSNACAGSSSSTTSPGRRSRWNTRPPTPFWSAPPSTSSTRPS